MSDFLPKDYKEPTDVGNYFKVADGDNVIRILSKPVMGNEVWIDENGDPRPKNSTGGKYTPKRFDVFESIPSKYAGETKFFWALVIYNVKEDRIQVWQISQATIRKAITALSNNPKWGDPYNYNLVITKEGEKLATEYTVTPEPKEEMDPEILKKYESMNIDLSALLRGENPFEAGSDKSEKKSTKKSTEDDEIDIDDVPFD